MPIRSRRRLPRSTPGTQTAGMATRLTNSAPSATPATSGEMNENTLDTAQAPSAMTASRAMPGHGDVGRVSGGAPVTATAWGTITSTFAQPTLTGSGSNCRRPWLTCGST